MCPENCCRYIWHCCPQLNPRSWDWTEGYAEAPEMIPAFFSYAALISICHARNFTCCCSCLWIQLGFLPHVLANQCFVPEETGCISLQCQTELCCGLIQVFTASLSLPTPLCCLCSCLHASLFPWFLPSASLADLMYSELLSVL